MISGETVVVIVLPRADGSGEVNVSVRGMMPDGLELRGAKLIADGGRWFTPGQREVVVSDSIHKRFAHCNIGDTLQFGKGSWKVVGIFDSGGTAYGSEIWGDVNQMNSDFDRQGVFSSAYLRATDPVAAEALKNRVSDDQRLKLDGALETEYYAKQTSSGAVIRVIGWIVAIIMAIGSSFAAMNTMYAAVAYRSREIATLRVIGFSRPSILTSFVFESVLLSLLGSGGGNRADAALQRHDHGNAESDDLCRSRVQPANDAGGDRVSRSLCRHHGTGGRDCAGLACGAAEHSERIAGIALQSRSGIVRVGVLRTNATGYQTRRPAELAD